MATSAMQRLLDAAIKPRGFFQDLIDQLGPILLEFLEMWLSSCTFSAQDAIEKASNPGIVSLIMGQRRLTRACRRNRDFAALSARDQHGIVVSVFDDVASVATDQPKLIADAWESLRG